jgi:hypothetical protein
VDADEPRGKMRKLARDGVLGHAVYEHPTGAMHFVAGGQAVTDDDFERTADLLEARGAVREATAYRGLAKLWRLSRSGS